ANTAINARRLIRCQSNFSLANYFPCLIRFFAGMIHRNFYLFKLTKLTRMEVTLHPEKEELAEPAKMIYLAQNVVGSSGPFSKGYKYPHFATVKSVQNRVNEALLKVIADTGLVERVERNGKVLYEHTLAMEDEMRPVLEEYETDASN